MRPDMFRNVVVDPNRQARLLQRPVAKSLYVVHFTPRSGSSWLTDIIVATRKLGSANEVFNPDFIPQIAQQLDATDMNSYIRMLLRVFNSNGVFGLEVTAHQIDAVFRSYAAFHEHFGEAPCFWLIRQDIVAQAVSLAKMVATSVAHSTEADAQAKLSADQRFVYDPVCIMDWLEHIRAAEVASEAWFSLYGLSPLRMSYEQTTLLSPLQMVNVIARHMGLPDIAPQVFPTGHTKLGTAQNVSFADRFREEQARFLAKIDAERSPMLARLHPISEMVADL